MESMAPVTVRPEVDVPISAEALQAQEPRPASAIMRLVSANEAVILKRVLIIGAGGHAQVVADVLGRMGDADNEVTPIGYLDDDPALLGNDRLGLPVLGNTKQLSMVAHDAIVVAIGDNETRRHLFERWVSAGERLIIACHPSATIAPDVLIGPGTMICARVVVSPGSRIGADVILNTACTVDHHNVIGDHVHVAPGVRLGGDVTIGEGTLVGISATVMPQRTVGAWSVIGAGSLVSKDIPSYSVAVGVPARVIRRLDHSAAQQHS
jgi:sugar O-acyltransferase (sialic acid O-acetyltransferase NeuD family)